MTSLPHNKPGKLSNGDPETVSKYITVSQQSYIKALEAKIKKLNEWRLDVLESSKKADTTTITIPYK